MDIVRTPPKTKMFVVGADEPISSEPAKALKEGIVSDVVQGECEWEKKGEKVCWYPGAVSLFPCFHITQMRVRVL